MSSPRFHVLGPALGTLLGCAPNVEPVRYEITSSDLKPGGVFVAYNLGCERGCDAIERGDLILAIDGRETRTSEDFDSAGVTDGAPHSFRISKRWNYLQTTVEVVAKPSNRMAPISAAPPFWTIGADALNSAPEWARRKMFARASPGVAIVCPHKEAFNARTMYGKKFLILYWSGTRGTVPGAAETMHRVMERARSDLLDVGVEVLSVVPEFPEALERGSEKDGGRGGGGVGFASRSVPVCRTGSRTPGSVDLLGMDSGPTVLESLTQGPAIVVLDERGIVRWHSEGLIQAPGDPPQADPVQYPILQAVVFALSEL